MSLQHQCENGQIVSYPTAESKVEEDGVVKFYDVHGNEVGSQLLHVAALIVVEATKEEEPNGVMPPPPNPPGSLGSALTEEEKKENEKHDDSKPVSPSAPDAGGTPAA
jgi:hypothetical protein